MAEFQIRIQGFDALKRRLGLVEQRLRRNILRGAMRAATAVIRKAARALVPLGRTGNLRRSIRVSTRAFADGRVVGTVKAGGKLAWYANIVEAGARPHVITSRDRTGKGALQVGGRVVRSVQHPGFRGRRYMARAAEQSEAAASSAFERYVQQRVAAAMAGKE